MGFWAVSDYQFVPCPREARFLGSRSININAEDIAMARKRVEITL